MMRKRRTRIWISMALSAGALLAGGARRAQAADDTARFYGAWIAILELNGQMVVVESIHDGSGYKNYVRLPDGGSTPAGGGSFSASNGKWTATAAAPDNSGTYTFADDYTAVCTNAAGQTVHWLRLDVAPPTGVTPPNYTQSMTAFLGAANAGATWAMNEIGDLYDYGLGVSRNYQLAMSWYQRAAAGGDGCAMNQIGHSYESGEGVAKDYQQAMAWYQKAAAAQSDMGMYSAGLIYYNGIGVAKDYKQAMVWFQRAAAGQSVGSVNAMNAIGILYQYGDGVAVDYQQAMAWFQKAAAAESAGAMEHLGYLYLNGKGVPADRNKAIVWYRASAAAGDAPSQQWLQQNGLL